MSGAPAMTVPVPALVDAYVAPASYAQERLWLLDRLDPGVAAYAVPIALRLRGRLEVAALQAAWTALGARHEALRTTLRELDGATMQVIAPARDLPLRVEDLTGLAPEERETEAWRRVAAEVSRPFDLAAGPLVRLRLYRLGPEEHVLLANLHHAVTDGWSNGVILRELAALYAAELAGGPPPLTEPELQYADWSEWQRERLEADGEMERQLAYWREALADAPAVLELPTDRPRAAVREGRAATERFVLEAALVERVAALARARGTTPFAVLLAAWSALLARYALQEEVVVGTPVANRVRPETHGVVGFFANTLALRADLRGDPSFGALVERMRERTVAALAHQETPFERLVEALKVPRSAARTPLFQAMFILQNAPASALALPGVEAEAVEAPSAHAAFDLTLALRERAGEMEGALEYAAALFDPETARGMVRRFRALLEAGCAAPETRCSALPLLDAAEARAALAAWEGDALEAQPEPVHARILAHAARTPYAVAVEGAEETLSYGALAARSAAVARALAAAGAGRGSLVAVRAGRSPATVAAILGVLRAGCAYLPLDPAYPAERQAYMLADSGAAVLLDGGAEAAPEGFRGRRMEIASLAPEPSAAPFADVPVGAEDLAYAIYTSGSTGRPKGVAVPHGALAGYVETARRAYRLTHADRVLQFAPLSFDSSVEELFLPLACGAAMVLREPRMTESVAGFWRAVAERRLTVASLPTAFWHELAREMERAPAAVPPMLRVLIVGGERVQPERVEGWHRHGGGRVRLVDSYGPTETTVAATLAELDRAGGAAAGIGRPLAGYRVRVLDGALRPVPPGIPGELFVGGIGVARGYLHRPAATAERFLPDPFHATPGARMYATGDRVRWRDDGSLRFLGRVDGQVKIRGFRIEPAEVEAALGALPGVREAAVAVREDAPGEPRLVGYAVPATPDATPAGLRAALGAVLPAHLLPAAIVLLDRLPLSPSGKLDRAALPAPPSTAPSAGAALSPRETAVAALWCEVLGIDGVGPEDNFFDLGGNSLLLLRVAAGLEDSVGRAVTAVDLFRFPTVRTLAAHLDGTDEPAATAADGARAARLRAGTGRLANLRNARAG